MTVWSVTLHYYTRNQSIILLSPFKCNYKRWKNGCATCLAECNTAAASGETHRADIQTRKFSTIPSRRIASRYPWKSRVRQLL